MGACVYLHTLHRRGSTNMGQVPLKFYNLFFLVFCIEEKVICYQLELGK